MGKARPSPVGPSGDPTRVSNNACVGIGKHGSEYVPFIRLMQHYDDIKEQAAASSIPGFWIEPVPALAVRRNRNGRRVLAERLAEVHRSGVPPDGGLSKRWNNARSPHGVKASAPAPCAMGLADIRRGPGHTGR